MTKTVQKINLYHVNQMFKLFRSLDSEFLKCFPDVPVKGMHLIKCSVIVYFVYRQDAISLI